MAGVAVQNTLAWKPIRIDAFGLSVMSQKRPEAALETMIKMISSPRPSSPQEAMEALYGEIDSSQVEARFKMRSKDPESVMAEVLPWAERLYQAASEGGLTSASPETMVEGLQARLRKGGTRKLLSWRSVTPQQARSAIVALVVGHAFQTWTENPGLTVEELDAMTKLSNEELERRAKVLMDARAVAMAGEDGGLAAGLLVSEELADTLGLLAAGYLFLRHRRELLEAQRRPPTRPGRPRTPRGFLIDELNQALADLQGPRRHGLIAELASDFLDKKVPAKQVTDLLKARRSRPSARSGD